MAANRTTMIWTCSHGYDAKHLSRPQCLWPVIFHDLTLFRIHLFVQRSHGGKVQRRRRGKKIAHGFNRGLAAQKIHKPRQGRKKSCWLNFCRPCRGLNFFWTITHG
jgi:hypothetical protein